MSYAVCVNSKHKKVQLHLTMQYMIRWYRETIALQTPPNLFSLKLALSILQKLARISLWSLAESAEVRQCPLKFGELRHMPLKLALIADSAGPWRTIHSGMHRKSTTNRRILTDSGELFKNAKINPFSGGLWQSLPEKLNFHMVDVWGVPLRFTLLQDVKSPLD